MKSFAFKKNILFSAFFVFVLTGCDGTNSGHFEVAESLQPRTIVGGKDIPGPDILNQLLRPIPQDVKGSEKFQREEFDSLNSVQLDALTLNISESSIEASDFLKDEDMPDNFDFLSSLKIYILANINGTNKKQLVASIDDSAAKLEGDLQTLNFKMTGVDILPYIEASDGYQVQYEASGDVPPDDVTFEGEVRYRVGVAFK